MKLQSSVKYTNTVLTKEYMLKCYPIDLYYFHKESQEKKKGPYPTNITKLFTTICNFKHQNL